MYKEKFEGAVNNAQNIEVLILGNSHANYGVDPNVFEKKAYNLANVNQSLYFDKRLTLKLLPKMRNLKYVLISADYHTFSFASQGIRDIWSFYGHGIKYQDKNYILEQLSPSLFGYPPKVVLSFLKRDFINMFYYDWKGVDFPVQQGVNLMDSIHKGFIGYEGTTKNKFSSRKYDDRASVFNDKVKKSRVTEMVSRDLDSFLENLKSRGVIPILFTPPTFKEYNKSLDPHLVKEVRNRFKMKSEKYHIPYWNFMNSNSFKIEYFYDMDHLNKRGANKFGQMLNDSLKKLDSELNF